MLFIEFAFCLVWVGALLTYLSSTYQQLLSSPLPKKLCWSILPICVTLSTYLLSMTFAVVSSLLFSIGILLMSWICLIFIAGHWKVKVLPLTLSGLVTLIFLAQLAGV